MRSAFASTSLLLALVLSLGMGSCRSQTGWQSPGDGDVVTTFSFDAVLRAPAALDASQIEATLNGQPLALVEGPEGTFTATIEPGPPLRDDNRLVATMPLGGSDATVAVDADFAYLPPGKARAFEITDPGDLLEGPLAHNQLGDFMLENDVARFVVQRAGLRDLHSVGQFGGNLIDAELKSNPGQDNFFEIQPASNIETVINATSVVVLNDGQDGTAAIVEACGPDDLIDYINASAQIDDFGAVLPAGVDDEDKEVIGCTRYVLEPRLSDEAGDALILTTELTNTGSAFTNFFVGDYINGMGELEQFTPILLENSGFNGAIGELLINPEQPLLSYFGFGAATGTSYGLVGLGGTGLPFPDSSFTVAGVSFVVTTNSIVQLLITQFPIPTLSLAPGATGRWSRAFVVGGGSAGDVRNAEVRLRNRVAGTVQGCVSVGGEPAPGARVSAGGLADGRLSEVFSSFVTDESGCYRGQLPVGPSYGIAASREGTPFEPGGPTATLPLVHPIAITDGAVVTQDIFLPATGRLAVSVEDPALAGPLPARVTVVGFDPSPDPGVRVDPTGAFPLGGVFGTEGAFGDITKDALPFGIAAAKYSGADGQVVFDLEPGSYQVFVSRGTEYSLYEEPVDIQANATTNVAARITRVLDTPGFVSSDYHVHAINSPDSRINLVDRSTQLAGEGVENYIATDHDARTDPKASILAEGLEGWIAGTIGEEITTFDTGHYNGYPLGVDSQRPTNGATDWARAAPPGADFPALGSFIRSPAEIHAEVLNQVDSQGQLQNTSPHVVVQINHISSHFTPFQIDTSLEPPQSQLSEAEVRFHRLDPSIGNFFHAFPALELWNGSTRGQQAEFTEERIGIWMNLLNQGIATTFIADTDTHTFLNLRTAGARTWTASPTDLPEQIDPDDVGAAVLAGQAVGGQGLYVQTRLRETDAPGNAAHLGLAGSTTLQTAGDGNVELEIHVQAPLWADFDTIEIYANATTFPVASADGTPVLFDAVPTRVLAVGTDTAAPAEVVVDPDLAGARRQELVHTEPFALTQDTWFVVVVRGSDGVSRPMFPVYPSDLVTTGNETLTDLLDGNLGEWGTLSLGATNALWADVDGTAGFAAPGVRLAP